MSLRVMLINASDDDKCIFQEGSTSADEPVLLESEARICPAWAGGACRGDVTEGAQHLSAYNLSTYIKELKCNP